MDKETLIKLATPASIVALAISILSIPLTTKAEFPDYRGSSSYPIHVEHMNSCS